MCVTPSFYVYILYSPSLDRYYTGSTALLPVERLEQHNSDGLSTSFTKKGKPWDLVFSFSCSSRLQATRVERHIKRMKSRTYIGNLLQYPELRQKLVAKFSEDR